MNKYSPSTIERFWSKVRKTRSRKACWEWQGARRKGGYGAIKVGRVNVQAHRMAWEIHNNEELGKRMALHKCDNPRCCNPHHIYAGSASDNMRDIRDRGPHAGHKLSMQAAEEIREAVKNGCKPKWIAADYGVSVDHVRDVARGKVWVPKGGLCDDALIQEYQEAFSAYNKKPAPPIRFAKGKYIVGGNRLAESDLRKRAQNLRFNAANR